MESKIFLNLVTEKLNSLETSEYIILNSDLKSHIPPCWLSVLHIYAFIDCFLFLYLVSFVCQSLISQSQQLQMSFVIIKIYLGFDFLWIHIDEDVFDLNHQILYMGQHEAATPTYKDQPYLCHCRTDTQTFPTCSTPLMKPGAPWCLASFGEQTDSFLLQGKTAWWRRHAVSRRRMWWCWPTSCRKSQKWHRRPGRTGNKLGKKRERKNEWNTLHNLTQSAEIHHHRKFKDLTYLW